MTAFPFSDEIRPHIVAMGASGAQGLTDITEMLRLLPADLDAAVLVVLHRPFGLPSRLREVLSRASRMPVRIARRGERLRAGNCYIGEPAAHLTLDADATCHLIDDPDCALRGRTVDALFCSLASHPLRRTAGVVLSGALNDGALGLISIKAAGGCAMVLGANDSRHSGMPENARLVSRPDLVGSHEEIARAVESCIAGTTIPASTLTQLHHQREHRKSVGLSETASA